ncbi:MULTISPECIES: ABC-F family ATPase [unclassified Methylophilus]|jgi:ATPase subunit of ABC transporter with duplicated ATPase domains|uniref:ABC-F family ATPase n=1 Tax=unclassified Methylophilus TaxID=2630143 RepID=UPI0006F8F1AA|nr:MULTISPECIES: ABC-F family ATPase [unclassified Methylophilus]KQT43434.1 ABC transporter ATP-binding protein [Methylophilus sp. Leaf416]KQT58920.1 ABC transporter ATP-binding protein [Methylophilus sp. Leaf459]
MLVANNITMQFGSKPLFENVSVKFGDGNRYGLIGANGCGKSTFMKILAGVLEPTSGNVSLDPNERMAFLKQDQFAYEDQRVLDVVMMGHEQMWKAMQERDAIYANLEATEDDYMRAAELEGEFAEYDGYTAEARAGELLLGVGIPIEQHTGLMSAVAPGWKLRVLLVQALFANPDVLLLDEPTNNLDINTIRWLEDIVNNRDCTMVIISHDRHFLNQVCTHTCDMDYGKITSYPGNYDDYMEASIAARNQQAKDNAKAKQQIADLQDFVRRFSANASKAKQATSRAKQIDKIKVEEFKPSSRQYPFIRFEFDDREKLHRNAVELKKLSHGFDKPLFNNVEMMFEAGEKVAIIGENGIGKTTFLRALAGDLQPKHGEVKWAEKAKLGYFAQDHEYEFEKGEDLFEWMTAQRQQGDDDNTVRSMLGRLLFPTEATKKSVKVLSGGEKGRMLYGKLMLAKTNVLLMDEPTNHMDMESIEALNTALDKYKGTLFFVSHDREFVSSIATRIIEIKADGIVDFTGNYEDYLASQGIE